jgi:hypothetical protein
MQLGKIGTDGMKVTKGTSGRGVQPIADVRQWDCHVGQYRGEPQKTLQTNRQRLREERDLLHKA